MTLLHIIDTLCDVTTKQADLLRELVTDLEHMNQVSEEVKNYYRDRCVEIVNVRIFGFVARDQQTRLQRTSLYGRSSQRNNKVKAGASDVSDVPF